MRFVLALFIAIPILEMIILIKVGGLIGALPTIGLVVLTAVIGVWLLKMEGMATWVRVQEKLQSGEIPGVELLEGIMLIIGGALLLTPGFFTDIIGFICLIPGLRRPLARKLISSNIISPFKFNSGSFSTFTRGGHSSRPGSDDDQSHRHQGEYTEGEYKVIDEERDQDLIDKHKDQ